MLSAGSVGSKVRLSPVRMETCPPVAFPEPTLLSPRDINSSCARGDLIVTDTPDFAVVLVGFLSLVDPRVIGGFWHPSRSSFHLITKIH